MALKLKKPSPYNGTEVEYWMISTAFIDYLRKHAEISLSGFVNKTARDAGKSPVLIRSFTWDGDEFPFNEELLTLEGNTLRSLSYKKIKESRLDEKGKETNEWTKSLDV